MKAIECKWLRKVHGRKEGQIETIDPDKEPRVITWLASGLIEKTEAPKKNGKGTRKEND